MPLFKNKGDKNEVENYRPIALLSPVSKVIEKEIQNQINTYMKENELWNKDMNTYRQNFSTATAILDIFETWTENLD